MALTDEGEAFYERCLTFLTEAEEMDAMFRTASHQIAGRIRVEMPSRIGRLIVAPKLPDFLAQWPGIRVELGMTDRTVDLVSERVDCALRVGHLSDSGLRARRLGQITQINVASPGYLAVHGTPRSPGELESHWQIAYHSPSTGRVADWKWQEAGRDHSRRVAWRVSVNSAEGYIAAALAGLGLIQIPSFDVAGHLTSGELVEVMPTYRPEPMPMTLLFPGRPRLMQRLNAFANWLEPVVVQAIGWK